MGSHPDALDIEVPGLGSQLISGQWSTDTGATFVDVISPTTEEAVARVALPSIRDADAAVAAARSAFDHGPWPRLPVEERVQACANPTLIRIEKSEFICGAARANKPMAT